MLVAGWILFLGQPTALSRMFRNGLVRLCTPFVRLGDLIPVVRARRDLDKANQQLRAENEVLRQQVRALSETGRENLRLEKLANLRSHIIPRTVGARVIGRDTSNWWRTVQLDRGTNDGVTTNQAVVSADGLVGKVVAVTKGESRVLLMLDPSCKVSAMLQDSREPGVVSGVEDAFLKEPRCQMTFVSRDAKVKGGEAIISSGLGGVFPKGLLIGTAGRANLDPQSGLYMDVDVKPAADFRRLEEVIVLLGPQ